MKNKHFLQTYSLASYCILFNPNPFLESCCIPAWWIGYAVLAPLELAGSAGRMLITTEVRTVSRRVRDVARFLHMEKMVSVCWGLQMSWLSVFEAPLIFIKVVLATETYRGGTDIKVRGNTCGSLCIICWLLQLPIVQRMLLLRTCQHPAWLRTSSKRFKWKNEWAFLYPHQRAMNLKESRVNPVHADAFWSRFYCSNSACCKSTKTTTRWWSQRAFLVGCLYFRWGKDWQFCLSVIPCEQFVRRWWNTLQDLDGNLRVVFQHWERMWLPQKHPQTAGETGDRVDRANYREADCKGKG